MRIFSQAFLVFLMKESKKRRRKQPGKLMGKSRSQLVNLPGARPLMNPLHLRTTLLMFLVYFLHIDRLQQTQKLVKMLEMPSCMRQF